MSEARKLAAIMFTDMVGYTALTQTDEDLALKLLDEQGRILRPIFHARAGREVKTIGDAFLVEFESALDAVLCAVELQTALHDHNEAAAEQRRIRLRVGIHLGDVAHRGNDVFGDAVNIASRIEPLAEPEGICISEQVFDQVRNKVKTPLVKLGPTELKGVQFAIEVYKVVLPWEARPVQAEVKGSVGRRVAVLPFANMSPDPKDEFFADGMTEEVITTLSKMSELRVISRTSVMRYKGSGKGLGEISKELGVGNILEGSIRKADQDVRISVQLIDARSDEHLWSEDYDRRLENVFAVQKDIAGQVAKALRANLLPKEAAMMSLEGTSDPEAYTYFLQGMKLLHDDTEPALREAQELFGRVVAKVPTFARGYSVLGETNLSLGNGGYDPYEDSAVKAEDYVRRALDLNPDLAEAHATLSLIRYAQDRIAEAESEARRAIALSPSLAIAHLNLAEVLALVGRIGEALQSAEISFRLDPLSPRVIGFYGHLLMYSGNEEGALEHWRRTEHLAPIGNNLFLAELYLIRKDYTKAEESVRVLERMRPSDSRTLMARGTLSAYTGKRERALEIVSRLEEASGEKSADVERVGIIQWALGNKDAFFDCMFKAVNMHALPGLNLRYSKLFVDAREDPRFRELFARIGVELGPGAPLAGKD